LPGFFIRGAGGIYSSASDLLKWQNAVNAGRVVPRRLYKLATTPARLLNGEEVPYGLGFSLKPDAADVRRFSHAGHWRAFKSDLSYYPDSRITVIQLTNNSEDDSVDANVSALARIAGGSKVPPILGPIGWDLVERINSGDAALAQMWFKKEIAANPRRYNIEEADLNSIGYAYLNQKSADKAETVCALTTIAFPRSVNALDSLADAQEAHGDIRAAHASIVAALAIDPSSEGLKKRAALLQSRLP
jgi:CubicO group peptidase (beta-lactamase class C family)